MGTLSLARCRLNWICMRFPSRDTAWILGGTRMKREPVKGKDFAGNDVSLYVTAPGHKDHQLAQLQYNMKVAELIRDGAGKSDRLLMRSEIEGYLTKMGIWTKEDQIAYNRIQADIRSNEI